MKKKFRASHGFIIIIPFIFFQTNGEYMVTFESSLLQEFCLSLRVFDMQNLTMQFQTFARLAEINNS